MPRVPVYSNLQVAPATMPRASDTTRADAASMGGLAAAQTAQAGEAMSNTGAVLGQIAVRLQQQENEDLTVRASTALRDEASRFMQQARERRGANAQGLTKEAEEWWSKREREIAQGLTNPVQQRMFQHRVAPVRGNFAVNLSGWESEQRRVSLDEASKASIVSNINLAAANWGDERVRLQAQTDMQQEVIRQAQRDGAAGEVLQARMMDAQTHFHRQVLQNMVDGGMPVQAERYFAQHRSEINGSEHDTLRGLFKRGSERVQAQRFVDEVVTWALSDTDSLAAIRAEFEGEQRDAAITEYKQRVAEREQIRRLELSKFEDDAIAAYERRQRFSDIPTSALERMDPNARQRLRIRAQQDADDARRRARGDGEPEAKSDLAVLDRIYKMVGTPAFSEIKFATEPGLSRSDRIRFMAMQSKPEEQRTVRLNNDMFNAAAVQAGLPVYDPPSKRNENENRAIGELRSSVLERLDAEQRARPNRPLTPEEIQDITESVVARSVPNPRSLFAPFRPGTSPVFSLPRSDPRRIGVEVDEEARQRGVVLSPAERERRIKLITERRSQRTLGGN